MNTVLIVGCGDIGYRIASLWQHQGAMVHTLNRSTTPCDNRSQHHIADLDKTSTLLNLPTKEAIVYYFAPPPKEGKGDQRMVNFLQSIKPDALPRRIIYISTSGVYGDCQGEWVTEETPAKPITLRSQRRLAAEQALQHWTKGQSVASVILRVGGIYGPGRLPLARLQQGMPVLRRDQAPFSNRIHADDLAQVCIAAANAPQFQAIYNVSDGQPSTMSDYFITVARIASLKAPQEVDWETAQQTFTAEMLSYLRESKRLDCQKMRRDLDITLIHPNLASGIRASLAVKND